MWMKKDFEDAAQKIGTDFMASAGAVTIDDLATKVAEDARLSPEGIRTVVRLANVAVFENRFNKSANDGDGDRMDATDFEVGDAEKVINRVYANAKEAHLAATKTDTYNQQVDLFGDIAAPTEKVAAYENEDEEEMVGLPDMGASKKDDKDDEEDDDSEEESDDSEEEKKASPQEIRHLMKRAHDRLHEKMVQSKIRWESHTKEAARRLVAIDGRVASRTAFEKDAVAMLGDGIVPELIQVQDLTSPKGSPTNLFGGEKLASVVTTHIAFTNAAQTPIIELLKEAQQARGEYVTCKASLSWIEDKLSKV